VKVLVIPEDPRLDQYILKPIVERIFADLHKSPRVTVLSNPRLRGVAEALNPEILSGIVANYPMSDLFLVLVDRDGSEARAGLASSRETEHPGRLLVCLAVEEIEVWMLACHSEAFAWRDVRSEIHPKERFANPFLKERAPQLDPGQGRTWAMRALSGQWRGVLDRCPELKELKQRIESWLAA
jgi:hypothetical protein